MSFFAAHESIDTEVIALKYGERDGFNLYLVYEEVPSRLSIRVFNANRSDYEKIKSILFDEAKSFAQLQKEKRLGNTAYTFFHKGGKISFQVKEMEARKGLVNIYLVSGPSTSIILRGNRFEGSEK